MKTIGIVGGVASGKSRVAAMLAELGAGLLDADRVAHEVLAEDREVHAALRERWGERVFAADGSVDRGAVGKLVFGDTPKATTERRFLEGLLHPRIRGRLEEARRSLEAAGKSAVVLDVPLLLEVGWDGLCDVILMVDTERETRLDRALKRAWSEEEFNRREASQWAVDRKRERADVVMQNNGDEAELRRAVEHFWERASTEKP